MNLHHHWWMVVGLVIIFVPPLKCIPKYVLMKKIFPKWSDFFKPFQCIGYFNPKHKDAKIFEIHLNPVMLVFIR